MKKALIAMSGGVDSSVAAALMLERGYECIGVTMKLYDNDEIGISREKTCCSLDDIEDARGVARKLGFPYYVFNFREDFQEKVIDKFADCYMHGITPNPCIDCNRYLKFEQLYKRAVELGCDTIVTGHYARIRYNEANKRYVLMKGIDAGKDQSYVLYSLTQDQLSHTVFPLGELDKSEVRKIAEEKGLLNAHKHDSQDICFVPDGNYKKFLEKYTGKVCPDGNFVDEDGNIMGRHDGICNYTIGQRKGLGIAFGHPVFVSDIRPETNEVVLSSNESLFSKECTAEDFNWVSYDRPEKEVSVSGKIRYRAKEAAGTAVCDGDKVHMTFDVPQRAITCGQALVLYDGDDVVGGGTICGKGQCGS